MNFCSAFEKLFMSFWLLGFTASDITGGGTNIEVMVI
jgi:hypothetical protein